MLKLEISLPDKCHERSKVIDVCAELGDEIVYLKIRLCAYCETPFIPIRVGHLFCYRPRCKTYFHRNVTRPVTSEPSNR